MIFWHHLHVRCFIFTFHIVYLLYCKRILCLRNPWPPWTLSLTLSWLGSHDNDLGLYIISNSQQRFVPLIPPLKRKKKHVKNGIACKILKNAKIISTSRIVIALSSCISQSAFFVYLLLFCKFVCLVFLSVGLLIFVGLGGFDRDYLQ